MKRISTKLPEKLHKNQSLHFKEHFTDIKHDISHIFMHFFFCPTNLSFTFNWVLIQYSSPEFIYISTVWLSFTALGILEFIQYLYALKEKLKSWWGWMFFFYGLKLQNVLLCYYFLWEIRSWLRRNYSWRKSLIITCRLRSWWFSVCYAELFVSDYGLN